MNKTFNCTELIDTCWNVNEFLRYASLTISRINRYMLECKYLIHHYSYIALLELIDTCWNVNF